MPRRPRLQYPGALYHVMARGNRKGSIFEDDQDRRKFLATLGRVTDRYGVRCYAFCLMRNHYHLVLETPHGNLSDAMRQMNGVYTQASNRRHQRTGHLFEGRFHSLIVECQAYLRDLARYVVLNPVRAGLVRDASAWPWSSYRATAGLEPAPQYLFLDWLEHVFGGASRHEAQLRYRLFVNDSLTKAARLDVHKPMLATPAFETALREAHKADRARKGLPRSWRALARPSLADLFSRCGDASRADRNRVIAQAHVIYGYRLAEIAAYLGLHPSTPSAALRRLEVRTGISGRE